MALAGTDRSRGVLRHSVLAVVAAGLAFVGGPAAAEAPVASPADENVRCAERYFAPHPEGAPEVRPEQPILLARGNVRPPVKLHAPPPAYPETARAAGLQGVVIVQTVIGEDGKVACARVLKGLSAALDEAALAAVKQWRFEPARVDDEPREVYYFLTVEFRLGDETSEPSQRVPSTARQGTASAGTQIRPSISGSMPASPAA